MESIRYTYGTIGVMGSRNTADTYWYQDLEYASRHSLKKIVLEDGITGIGDRCFYCCNDLIDITLPESLTSIGEYALYYCSKLEIINIESIESWMQIPLNEYNTPLCKYLNP